MAISPTSLSPSPAHTRIHTDTYGFIHLTKDKPLLLCDRIWCARWLTEDHLVFHQVFVSISLFLSLFSSLSFTHTYTRYTRPYTHGTHTHAHPQVTRAPSCSSSKILHLCPTRAVSRLFCLYCPTYEPQRAERASPHVPAHTHTHTHAHTRAHTEEGREDVSVLARRQSSSVCFSLFPLPWVQ